MIADNSLEDLYEVIVVTNEKRSVFAIQLKSKPNLDKNDPVIKLNVSRYLAHLKRNNEEITEPIQVAILKHVKYLEYSKEEFELNDN